MLIESGFLPNASGPLPRSSLSALCDGSKTLLHVLASFLEQVLPFPQPPVNDVLLFSVFPLLNLEKIFLQLFLIISPFFLISLGSQPAVQPRHRLSFLWASCYVFPFRSKDKTKRKNRKPGLQPRRGFFSRGFWLLGDFLKKLGLPGGSSHIKRAWDMSLSSELTRTATS